ncbi:unnamed protein product [Rotaria sp. Silwood2]|nr:unnamed protein product [Rotaria sp. Silwood2]
MPNVMEGDVKIHPPNSLISSSVQYLHSETVSIDLLSLLAVAPMLHTLEAKFKTPDLKLGRIHPHLLYLQRLQIELCAITWTEMVTLLSSFPRLTYLAVFADDVDDDMADGFAWAQSLQHIKHFEFELQFSDDAFQQQPFNLDSFRTKFWLEEKKWFVTYDRSFKADGCLMHYSSNFSIICYPSPQRIRTVISESNASESTFFSYVHCLIINDQYLKCQHLHSYTNIKKLYLSQVTTTFPSTLKDLTAGLDTSQITTCSIGREWNKNLPYEHIEFLRSLPRLCRLEVSGISLSCLFLYQWPHIIHLKTEYDYEHRIHVLSSNDIDALCHSFTHIERLDIHSSSIPDLAQVINRMKMTLREIRIRQPRNIDNEQFITREWIKRNTDVQNFYYTCDDGNVVRMWL